MALVKSIITTAGIEATYHVISALHIYPEKRSVHIDVDSYVSREMKDGGYAPLITYQFEFAGEEYPFTGSISIDGAYAAVKMQELLADALEV